MFHKWLSKLGHILFTRALSLHSWNLILIIACLNIIFPRINILSLFYQIWHVDEQRDVKQDIRSVTDFMFTLSLDFCLEDRTSYMLHFIWDIYEKGLIS
jgi:hypothetical protein